MFGDDCGIIHILYFKSPFNSLFDPSRRKTESTKSDKASANATQRIYWEVSKRNFLKKIIFIFNI
jgi:hypothetical protein